MVAARALLPGPLVTEAGVVAPRCLLDEAALVLRKDVHHWNAGIEGNQCAHQDAKKYAEGNLRLPRIVAVRFFKHHFFRRYWLTVGREKCSGQG